jgi:hypothetical protein
MTNPLLVEAIEDQFVPVLVYNNKKSDEKLLAHFKEPSWNNPVIRYLDAQENDLTPRKELVLTVPKTAQRMVDSLRSANIEIPSWLEAVAAPARQNEFEQATFAMY